MKPFLKYVGGKTKLLPELLKRAPKEFRHYYEPFVGGAAFFFALEPARATLGDMNEALIGTYRAIETNVEAVIEALAQFKSRHDESRDRHYYDIRKHFNAWVPGNNEVWRAAAFIYLNKTCFNGLWRVNKNGHFNVPVGKYANPAIYDPENLRLAAGRLRGAYLLHGDYKTTTDTAGQDDFVYFDPPYDPINKTSNFTTYTKESFDDRAQEALAEHARRLRRRGTYVLLSNNDTPLIRELYKDFTIETVKCARPINSKGDKRGEVDEVIITGAPT